MAIAAREPFSRIQKLNEFFIIFAIVQGILGLIQSRWSQRTVRNYLFSRLAPSSPKTRSSSFRTKAQWTTAKMMAATYYLLSVLMAICCPAFFVSNLVVQEILLFNYPISEPYTSVGQWSSWASLGLAVMAAVIDKFHGPVLDLIKSVFVRVFAKQKSTAAASPSVSFKQVACSHCRLSFSGRAARRLRWGG